MEDPFRLLGRAIWHGFLGTLVGAVVGVLVSATIGLFMGNFGILLEGALIGGVPLGIISALMSILDEEWSLLLLFKGGLRPKEPGAKTKQTKGEEPSANTPVVATKQERVQQSRKAVVLFLCTGNSARSQMAEAFLKKYAGSIFDVFSAGLRPKGVHPLTIQVMNEVGIDISGQQSKSVRQFLGKLPVRVAITVCAPAEVDCPRSWPWAPAQLSWPFEDPAAYEGPEPERLLKFRSVRDQVDQKIQNWLEEIQGSQSS